MLRHRHLLILSLAVTSLHQAGALDIPLDQVVLQLPKWTAMPDWKNEGDVEKRGKSPDGKVLVNAWTSINPKATVEQSVIYFILPLVASLDELKTSAETMKISSTDVEFITGIAKSSNFPIGNSDSKIKQVGLVQVGSRKIYYVLSKPDERGNATLFTVTQGQNPQTCNTAVYYGPPEGFANAAAFAKNFH